MLALNGVMGGKQYDFACEKNPRLSEIYWTATPTMERMDPNSMPAFLPQLSESVPQITPLRIMPMEVTAVQRAFHSASISNSPWYSYPKTILNAGRAIVMVFTPTSNPQSMDPIQQQRE